MMTHFHRWGLAAILTAMMTVSAQAHFIWVVTESADGTHQAKIYFGEDAAPDDPALLSHIKDAKAHSLGGWRSEPEALPLEQQDDALVAEIPEKNSHQPVIVSHQFGVMARGDDPFLLNYYAKTYPSVLPGSWDAVNNEKLLPLEVVPHLQGEQLTLQVLWNGKPQPGSEVTVDGPGLKEQFQQETNEDGKVVCTLADAGTYSIRARMIDETAGELDGKTYAAVRHYSTLTLPYTPLQVTSVKNNWPELEHGTTSFGAGIVGNELYVYGGHYGQAHHYSREGQSGDFQKLNLENPTQWESLPGGPKLTGLAMVAYDGKLYRVGGFTAENNDNEDEKLVSQDSFARFDPQSGEWESLPSLPEGRSSHDVAVVGDTLYVIGGWEMLVKEDQQHNWHSTAWSCDLSQPKLAWKKIANPPFHRRAISTAAYHGKLYVIGGMQEEGGPTTQVAIYDPKSDRWSTGPAILGTGMDGFGTAAFACADQLFVTTMSGSVQRLASDGSHWELVGQLEQPRFFHEMIPWNDELVVVAGASMAVGKLTDLERLPVGQEDARSRKAALK